MSLKNSSSIDFQLKNQYWLFFVFIHTKSPLCYDLKQFTGLESDSQYSQVSPETFENCLHICNFSPTKEI